LEPARILGSNPRRGDTARHLRRLDPTANAAVPLPLFQRKAGQTAGATLPRMLAATDTLVAALRDALPGARVITDPLRRLAYGTDASFYRLVPQVVLVVDSEPEVLVALAICRKHGAPLTFRAAGTSLSGQAISDSVLLVLGDGWRGATASPGRAAGRRGFA
jgi:hypothetical protein